MAKIISTSKQLWEMESQTDIVMFVDMNQMYLDNWKDEIINNIDAKYPFKNR